MAAGCAETYIGVSNPWRFAPTTPTSAELHSLAWRMLTYQEAMSGDHEPRNMPEAEVSKQMALECEYDGKPINAYKNTFGQVPVFYSDSIE